MSLEFYISIFKVKCDLQKKTIKKDKLAQFFTRKIEKTIEKTSIFNQVSLTL